MKKIGTLAGIMTMMLLIGCGGGSGGSGGNSASSTPASTTPKSFVTSIPNDSTNYYNENTGESASLWDLFAKTAYADQGIIELPTLAYNTVQSWWGGQCQGYDVANPNDITLYPLVDGPMKKLVVGQSYHMVLEVGRIEQRNPCSVGKAVTGNWHFTLSISSGNIDDNVAYSEFPTGELIITLLDNGTDYSTPPVVTVHYDGQDAVGAISGFSQFEIVKDPIQQPEVETVYFHGDTIKWKKPTYIDFSSLPEYVNIVAHGPHIDHSSWLATAGLLSSDGEIDGDTWKWKVGQVDDNHKVMMILANLVNIDNVVIQRKIMIYADQSGQSGQ